jgi:hypothetical protein
MVRCNAEKISFEIRFLNLKNKIVCHKMKRGNNFLNNYFCDGGKLVLAMMLPCQPLCVGVQSQVRLSLASGFNFVQLLFPLMRSAWHVPLTRSLL